MHVYTYVAQCTLAKVDNLYSCIASTLQMIFVLNIFALVEKYSNSMKIKTGISIPAAVRNVVRCN